MKPVFKLRYRYLKWKAQQKLPPYIFAEDKTDYLLYKRELHPKVRKLLNLVKYFLEWVIDKKDENEAVNRQILDSLGLDPNTDIISLDAFYKREFRKKKYMHFFFEKPSKNFPEPTRFMFEYMPKIEGASRKDDVRKALDRFSKK